MNTSYCFIFDLIILETYHIYTISRVHFLQKNWSKWSKIAMTSPHVLIDGVAFSGSYIHFCHSSAWVWVWMRAVQGTLFELVFEDCRRRGAQTQLYLFNHTHTEGTITVSSFYPTHVLLLNFNRKDFTCVICERAFIADPGFQGLAARWPAEPHKTLRTCSFTSSLRTSPKRRWSILGACTRLF